MNMDEDTNSKKYLVKKMLAEQIGVEPEDINYSNSFSDDLHMTSANITDFVESLSALDIDTNEIDLVEVKTLEDLLEVLDLTEQI